MIKPPSSIPIHFCDLFRVRGPLSIGFVGLSSPKRDGHDLAESVTSRLPLCDLLLLDGRDKQI